VAGNTGQNQDVWLACKTVHALLYRQGFLLYNRNTWRETAPSTFREPASGA